MTGLAGLAVTIGLFLAPGPGDGPDWSSTVEAIRGVDPDPAPPSTTNGIHYLTSNERRLDLFLPELGGRGGVHLGVGSDQNYIMAGWSRPKLMVLVDFDEAVVDMHAIYRALLLEAATPQRFVELWSTDGIDDAHAAIEAATPGRRRQRALIDLYDQSRKDVAKRTGVLLEKYDVLGIHWYLEDARQYAFVRKLAKRDRIVALRGDFTADGALREIGEVLLDEGLSVRTLYLSNIEQYFMYKKPYRDNMLGLPFDDRTLVLRTLPGRPAGFQYILQTGDNFRTWLTAKRIYSVYGIRKKKKGEHLEASVKWIIDELPPTKKTAKR